MTHSYYGGNRVTGKLQRLPAAGFRDLLERYFFSPVPLRYTRAEWFALDKDERDRLKDGPYICSCSFKDGSERRADENADKVLLVSIDLDKGGKDFTEHPETIAAALGNLNFVAYTTANHRPEDPRLRIMVECRPAPVKYHRRMVAHVAVSLLGIAPDWSGKRESNVISQPMFRPVEFTDGGPAAVIACNTDGEALDYAGLPEPPEEDDPERTYAWTGGDDNSSLAFLPIPDLEVEDLREALFAIDADGCGYKVWTEVAASLRHQFRDEAQAEEAFRLFDEWSETGTLKYKGEKETYCKWRSFRPDPAGRNPVTVRTLFKYAIDAGWDKTALSGKIQESLEEWIGRQNNAKFLMAEGPKRIAALPFKDEVAEESMIAVFRKKLSKVPGGHMIDKSAIRAAVKRHRLAEKRAADDGQVPAWLMPWCYVSTIDKFFHVTSGEELEPEAFNRMFGAELMPAEDSEGQAKNGKPVMQPADFALNVKQIRKVGGMLYDPRQGKHTYFTHQGREYVNLFRESTVPRENQAKLRWIGKVIYHHMETLIAEKPYIEEILDTFAFIVQNPGRKVRRCILIQSAEGAGKNIIFEWLRAALGPQNAKSVSPMAMADPKYNGWLANAQVVCLNEIWVQGPGRADIMNKLKEAVTDDTITYHEKYHPVTVMDNIVNLIAFTNHHDALFIGEGDRRYFIVKSRIQDVAEANRLRSAGHFDAPVSLFKNHAGGLRAFFMNRVVPETFNPDAEATVTCYREEMLLLSKNRMRAAIEDLIAGPDERIGEDIIDLSVLKDLTSVEAKANAPVERFLMDMNFAPHLGNASCQVNGHLTPVWVHRRRWDADFGDPVKVLTRRTEKYSKDL